MSRSFIHLRRALFSVAFVGSLGFGASQAVANVVWHPIATTCNPYDLESTDSCAPACVVAGYYGESRCWRGRCECTEVHMVIEQRAARSRW